MKKRYFIFSLLSFLLFFIVSKSFPLEKQTHSTINELIATNTIIKFSLDEYLNQQLGFGIGSRQAFTVDDQTKRVDQWMSEGGKAEDEPEDLWGTISNNGRSNNHFHNPLRPWDNAGLDDTIFKVFRYTGQSSLLWAQNPNQNVGGRWSWQDAKRYFYEGLTATDKASRDRGLAYTFKALGHLMHLVQDTSVPAHVRNSIHIRYNYEKWVEDIRSHEVDKFREFIRNPISFDKTILNASPNPQLAPIPIASIFDTDRYQPDNPKPQVTVSNAIGLTEYVNANFFSEGTIFSKSIPFPAKSSVEISNYSIQDPRDEAKTVTRQYFKKIKDGDTGYRLATVGFLRDYITKYFQDYTGLERKALDGGVYDDYAARLLPRAVGYSAGLLDYFFRGRLDVTSVPIFYKNRLFCLWLTIKNATPKEDMMGGHFVLTYRYTPEGGNSDGSNDVFGQAWASAESIFAEVDTLVSGDEEGQDFEFFMSGEGIPVESLASLRFTLAYQGKLGMEEGAVIGKVFTPGEIKFNEEWDKGLTGNHTWLHTGDSGYDNNDPEVGIKVNRIDGDTLVKENIRYRGQGRRHYNDSFIGISSASPGDPYGEGFPIAVTPNTYLQFKIDQLSMDPPFPRTIDSCADQFLELRFDHGLILQYTQPGQYGCIGSGYGVTVAYYGFDLGYVNVSNIYKDLGEAGMPIPEGGLFLRYVSLYQQIWGSYYPSAGEHKQRMEVDFIRIVEGKASENF